MVLGRKNKTIQKQKKAISLKKVTKLLSDLKLPLVYVFTPTNLKSERQKFFASDTYSPQFKYKIVANSNDKILRWLINIDAISDVDPELSDFYVELIKQKVLTNKLMQSVGDNEKITKYAYKKYGSISPVLFRNACRILRGKVSSYSLLPEQKLKQSRSLDFSEIKYVVDKVFQELGLLDWQVEKSQKSAGESVKMGLKKKRMYISNGIHKTPLELRKTIVHEIGTHVLRHINGLATGYEALSKANLPGYLAAEEGLAMYNEESMGLLSAKVLRKRALYVWCAGIGEGMSFRDLYKAVCAFKPKKASFDIVLRLKRGLGDTSKSGLYGKDIIYLRGFGRVRKVLRENPRYYQYLYAGKISLKQIRWVEDGLLPKAKFVPDVEVFRKIFKECGI